MKQEIWKDIKGYEGRYQISNLGNVKSLNYLRTKKEKLLVKTKHTAGYNYVHLYKNNKHKSYFIHRLVALHFIQNPKNKPCVNHIDGNKENNRVENLEWCTYSENNLHSYKKLLRKSGLLGKVGLLNKNSRKVNQYNLEGIFIKTWDCLKDVERNLGILQQNISKCALNKYGYKTAGGFIWKYD